MELAFLRVGGRRRVKRVKGGIRKVDNEFNCVFMVLMRRSSLPQGNEKMFFRKCSSAPRIISALCSSGGGTRCRLRHETPINPPPSPLRLPFTGESRIWHTCGPKTEQIIMKNAIYLCLRRGPSFG